MPKKNHIELAEIQKEMFKETANRLNGLQKRIFMAQVVERLGYGGQRFAEKELGWNRLTIRRGLRDLEQRNQKKGRDPSQAGIPKRGKKPELSSEMAQIYIETADQLNGERRRIFMAQVVSGLGRGGQRYAERVLGWNRSTIRKGMGELAAQSEKRSHLRGRAAQADTTSPVAAGKVPPRATKAKEERKNKREENARYAIPKIDTLTPGLIDMYTQTADNLRGQKRRIFMAQVVLSFGPGGQRLAERELGWNRKTIRLGLRDLEDRSDAQRRLARRGRKTVEKRFPRFTEDIRQILHRHDPQSIESGELSISIKAVATALINERGYDPKGLPSRETIRLRIQKILKEREVNA